MATRAGKKFGDGGGILLQRPAGFNTKTRRHEAAKSQDNGRIKLRVIL